MECVRSGCCVVCSTAQQARPKDFVSAVLRATLTLVKLREPSPEGYREALRLYRIIIMRGTLIRARRPHAAGDEMNLE